MAMKQCDKCEEMVDEAKAFCPGCGNAFLEEEQRQDVSKFEKMDSTVQMGQTMHNQMLSDMGLSISNTPTPAEKRAEVIAPIAPAASAPATPAEPVVQPAMQQTASRSWIKWVILALILLILLAVFLIIAAAVAIMFLPQLT